MPPFNSSRAYLEAFVRDASSRLPPGSRVLDAGAGDCRYGRWFDGHRYESADLCTVDKPYGELTYTCDLSAIPVNDGRFDAVVCTQVLEHVPEPETVLRELGRVLKPEGLLFLTVPLFYAEHEVPYDFQRFTRYGLERLLPLAGFEIERLDWLEGYLGTLSYQAKGAAAALPRWADAKRHKLLAPLLPVSALLRAGLDGLSDVLGRADMRVKVTDRGYCKNYAVVAKKRSARE
ncbi:MAG: class I SAM-dependent methyltransferase [Polyangiaceae bacterium]